MDDRLEDSPHKTCPKIVLLVTDYTDDQKEVRVR